VRQSINAQLVNRAQTLLAQKNGSRAIGDGAFGGGAGGVFVDPSLFAGNGAFAGSSGNGLLTGGVPINITNQTITNQSGVITNVTANTTVTGNNNAVAQSVGNIANGASFKAGKITQNATQSAPIPQ
jgi:hypothetical protein